jgi:uncharacterized protein (DUF362 family)
MSNMISRRGFIDRTAKGAASLLALPIISKVAGKDAADPLEKSRVVVVKHDNALKGSAFQQDIIQTMMNAGITALTGISDVGEAWKSLFPGITTTSVIGIKINCLFPAMSTHPLVANALLASLKRMAIGGSPFPENNIIIWDNWSANMRSASFTMNTSKTGVRYFGTDGNYDSTNYPIDGGVVQRLSKIITEQCNYLINFSVLKNHWTSGVSLSMKNHYGSIHNVSPDIMHANVAELQIASINALKPIRDKQVVCICDAIKGTISGGPSASPQVTPKSLIFSSDPVAHDYIGAQMLKNYGASTGDTSLTIMAKHISAAASRYGLGTCDPNQIEKIEVNNPTEIPEGVEEHKQSGFIPDGFTLHQNYPNPFNGRTFINYELPAGLEIRLRILNGKGQVVRRLFEGRHEPGWFQVTWDGTRNDGSKVSSGAYLCVLETDRERRTVKMQLVQ